ncbi:hypothetical protein [Sphaerisporangium sp. TRM90804]|uniref:hypothetical protein n=1 Tax=Sphaerisporangium sp. TRM90804 TaxID=3031113 RepID=UPI002448479D|nr:hypothetical protein [Sphaerisporangium sp. TRM90804]MDH2425716.1 hypothetical protein [Sphaerisporangium sp. TRM90804]
MTSSERSQGRRGAPKPWAVITAAVFVLATTLALAWPAGGLEEAEVEVPRRRLGEVSAGHRFTIVPAKVSLLAVDPAPAFGDAKPGRFLAVELRVENIGHDTATVRDLAQDLHLTVSPSGATIDRFKDMSAAGVIRDGAHTRDQLHPRLKERVLLVYTVPRPLPDPTHLKITMRDSEYKEGFDSELSRWRPGEDVVIYDLEVGR